MSLVFGSREVSAGPTVGFQGDVGASSPTAYVSKQKVIPVPTTTTTTTTTGQEKQGSSCFLERDTEFCFETGRSVEPDVSSTESSSIGFQGKSDDVCTSTAEDGDGDGDGDGDDDEAEVQSKFKGALGSMGSLEESLPIKRGLSNFFTGKSKSFANLSDVSRVTDLAKPENPFNKRRKTLIACKWSRRSFYSSLNPSLMPSSFTLNEDEEQPNDEEVQNISTSHRNESKLKSFKSPRCFSLSDLQQQHV